MFWYFFLIINSASAEFDPRNVSMVNWTTCEEFLKNYTEDLSKIVDVDWKIFYFWDGSMAESYIIKFSLPSTGLIDRHRIELAKEMRDVNWNDSALFMETSIDLSALYIRTNYTGIYRIIPNAAFTAPNCPYLAFALKVVEPGYLGIMNCKHRFAYALAPVESFPRENQVTEAASKLMFYNGMGRSYLIRQAREPQPRYEDDDIDDEELEMERQDLV